MRAILMDGRKMRTHKHQPEKDEKNVCAGIARDAKSEGEAKNLMPETHENCQREGCTHTHKVEKECASALDELIPAEWTIFGSREQKIIFAVHKCENLTRRLCPRLKYKTYQIH
jgi:hypothetical protein